MMAPQHDSNIELKIHDSSLIMLLTQFIVREIANESIAKGHADSLELAEKLRSMTPTVLQQVFTEGYQSISLSINTSSLLRSISHIQTRVEYTTHQQWMVLNNATYEACQWLYPSMSAKQYSELRMFCGLSPRPGRPPTVRQNELRQTIRKHWQQLRAGEKLSKIDQFTQLKNKFPDISIGALFSAIKGIENA